MQDLTPFSLRVFIYLLLWLAASAAWAQSPLGQGEQVRSAEIEAEAGRLKFGGSGTLAGDEQDIVVEAQYRRLFDTSWFASTSARVGQEQFTNYDTHRLGAQAGLGLALNDKIDWQGYLRWDRVSVFDVSPDTDPDILNGSGQNDVFALGTLFVRDDRSDSMYPLFGNRFRAVGELASQAFGGDDTFSRLQADYAWYHTPWAESSDVLSEITLAQFFRAGWIEDLGGGDEVPFYERYFVGGSSTVRGHRGRWLSPRGVGDQFVGGELQLIQNFEARLPIFRQFFSRRLHAAAFFDIGRAFRKLSDVGDFGFGAGFGLRYAVEIWEVKGLLRVDYGFNLAPEGDQPTSNIHITFGTPF